MDFGAMVCVARNPKCLVCPMAKSCRAFPLHPRTMTPIVVTAAVIEHDGRFLVTRRPAGVHLEGYWEFPGGKCDAGEALGACLARELREELDVDARIGGEIFTTTHTYPERAVELHFFRCELRRRAASAARSGDAVGAA